MTRKLVLLAFVMLLVLPATYAVAGKKKPKSWKSETVTIAIPAPLWFPIEGQMVNVTIQEFTKRCTVPDSQGFDAAIFEVPAEYQKVAASASAIGPNSGVEGYDLDMYFFDASCKMMSASGALGGDELAYMPKGTTWIAVLNSLTDTNVSVHIELEVYVPAATAVVGEQKPKSTWKGETVTIAVAHPLLNWTNGQVVNVTIKEFIDRCAVPPSQGFDAAIFKVPSEYQKGAARASAIGSSSGLEGYDLDMYFYDASCNVVSASYTPEADESGYMPRGTAWIAVLNHFGDPNVSVHIELKVY